MTVCDFQGAVEQRDVVFTVFPGPLILRAWNKETAPLRSQAVRERQQRGASFNNLSFHVLLLLPKEDR